MECHFFPPWRVTAFPNDVKWPTVMSMVNRCFYGKSKMANHEHEKSAKKHFSQEKIVTTIHHSASCPPLLFLRPRRALPARARAAIKYFG